MKWVSCQRLLDTNQTEYLFDILLTWFYHNSKISSFILYEEDRHAPEKTIVKEHGHDHRLHLEAAALLCRSASHSATCSSSFTIRWTAWWSEILWAQKPWRPWAPPPASSTPWSCSSMERPSAPASSSAAITGPTTTKSSIWPWRPPTMVTFLASILFTALGIFLAPLMLRFMSTPDDVLELALVYLRIYFSGIAGLLAL